MIFIEKLKLIRKSNNMTQAEFADSVGISRSNYSGIELGKVTPSETFIICVSLLYNIDKDWLLDDTNDDLSYLNQNKDLAPIIVDIYNSLDDNHKKFAKIILDELLILQKENCAPLQKLRLAARSGAHEEKIASDSLKEVLETETKSNENNNTELF